MKWIRDILTGACTGCIDYRVFRDIDWKPQKKERRYVVWCYKEDYAIILEERDRDFMLITAYKVIYQNKRNDLERLYQKSRKK